MEIRKKAVDLHSLLKHPACGRQANNKKQFPNKHQAPHLKIPICLLGACGFS